MIDVTKTRHVARIVIQFKTAFIVASGRAPDGVDAEPVFDANGLPTVPGTSLAGVLRHGWSQTFGASDVKEVFGWAGEKRGDGEGSRMWINFAKIHDSNDRPVDGLLVGADEKRLEDPVLREAAVPTVRDHVRIHHRGAADEGGKFDQAICTAGHRFTFDVVIEEAGPSDESKHDGGWILGRLVTLLRSDAVRLGGCGRRGLGSFDVVSARSRAFDMTKADDVKAFAAVPVSLEDDKAAKSWKDITDAGSTEAM